MESFLSSFSSWNFTTPAHIFHLILHSRAAWKQLYGKAPLCHYQEDRATLRPLDMKPHPAMPPTPAALCLGRSDLPRTPWPSRSAPLPSFMSQLQWDEEWPSQVLTCSASHGLPIWTQEHCNQLTLTEVCSESFSFPKGAQNSLEISEDSPLKTSKSGSPGLVDQDSWTSATSSTAVPAPEDGWPGGPDG